MYPTLEHASQAAKTLELSEKLRIAVVSTPLRPDWEKVKVDVMEDLVPTKFTVHQELRDQLLVTSDAQLIEVKTWNDRFWGVCNGQGRNQLGIILMAVRSELAKWSTRS